MRLLEEKRIEEGKMENEGREAERYKESWANRVAEVTAVKVMGYNWRSDVDYRKR
ncbi:hypothetical protein [Desulfosporosinus orientis]|uniref:hypothetical protein n=1 Tax=Desulfosporosinus orientis TaxID=1563 RepID=UPI000305B26A|nr:hypothetical protein [Desulfosporosinus orientis]